MAAGVESLNVGGGGRRRPLRAPGATPWVGFGDAVSLTGSDPLDIQSRRLRSTGVVPCVAASRRGGVASHEVARGGSRTRAQRAGRASRRCSSGVEQLICNQQVVGSTPTIGSIARRRPVAERYPSGQREQTVNLPANAFGGSNPPLSIQSTSESTEELDAGVAQLVEHEPSKLGVAGSIPVSRSSRRASCPRSSGGRALPW